MWCLSLIYDWLNSQYEMNLIMSLDCIIESHLLLIIKSSLLHLHSVSFISRFAPDVMDFYGIYVSLVYFFVRNYNTGYMKSSIFLCWYLVNTLQICAYHVQLFKTVLHFSFRKEFLCLGINLYCDRL